MTMSYPLFTPELQAPNSVSLSSFSGWLINQKRNSQVSFFCKHHELHLLQQNSLCFEWGQLNLPFVLNSLILSYLRSPFPPVLCFCTWIASCFLLHFLHSCFKCCFFFILKNHPWPNFPHQIVAYFSSLEILWMNQSSCLHMFSWYFFSTAMFLAFKVHLSQMANPSFYLWDPQAKSTKLIFLSLDLPPLDTWSTTWFLFVLLIHWLAENNSRGRY